MKTKMKTLVALCLVLCMAITACGKTEQKESTVTSEKENTQATTENKQVEESKYPEYLNMESYRPIVKEGEEITLKVATIRPTGMTTDINETWFVKFIEEELNINLEIEELTAENRAERKNLMLASGDVPDLLLIPLTNGEVVEYGVNGGELLPISDYFSEELTPNILDTLEKEPEAKAAATATDGKIYSVPKINAKTPGSGDTIGLQRVFIDTVYMEAAGITEVPTTLDGFVDMLRAFKKIDPKAVGVDECWPLVTRSNNDYEYFLNAFGFLQVDQNKATEPVWDVETQSVTVSCLTEKYAEFIKLYHTLYSEGLLHPDKFTMDNANARALYAEGKAAVNTDFGPLLFDKENFDDYVMAKPLTSKWSADEPVVTSALGYVKNLAFISADTEYPEVCVRFMDYLYSGEGAIYSSNGCTADSEDKLGIIEGFYLNDQGVVSHKDVDSGKFATSFEYLSNLVRINNDVYTMDYEKAINYQYELLGAEVPEKVFDHTNAQSHLEWQLYDNMNAYLEYPLAEAYLDAETNTRFTDLQSVLETYHDQEFAKFVVGQRPIEEVDKFLQELMDLGGKEYLELVKKVYGK